MTVLMSSWYYEKKDLKRSPSMIDGLDMERESRYRREGARFIINVGTKMGLRYDTMATGVVYFHRFYMFHSFKTFPRYVTACCCLFLAGKVEETPKKCKDIIKIAKTFLGDSQFAQFGDDPKEEVMTLERILLQTIKFDLQVDHPYGHLLKYAKCLKGDKVKLQNMVQMAWTFINDSLCTTLCLQWEPEVIAIALMYLAGKLSKFEVADWLGRTSRHSHWWDMFVEGMSVELLEDICHQVLDLYSTPNPNTPQDSPPATPPTKSTRKPSQPPSPVEVSASPVQAKPKEVPVGQPIPRLEPGELKRKVSQAEFRKDSVESKVTRSAPPLEGKAIPTITSSSPKGAASSQGSDTQPSSPSTPIFTDSAKSSKLDDHHNTVAEAVFRSGIAATGQPPYSQTATFLSNPDSMPPKAVPRVNPLPVQSFPPVTVAVSGSYAPPSNQYYAPENQHYVQQQPPPPPPQIFPQHPFPPPPPVPPSGPPPVLTHAPPPPPPLPLYSEPPLHQGQYSSMPPTAGVPPFNSQYPPPRLNNPPPPPPHPPGPPPGGLRPAPPSIPPPSAMSHPRMVHDASYGPRHNVTHDSRPARAPERHMRPNPDFGPRGHYEGERPPRFRGRRDDYDMPYHHDSSYEYDEGYGHMSMSQNQYGSEYESPGRPPMPIHQPRHFPMEHPNHRKHERGANLTQQGTPTGIPPVRITGSNR